MNRIMKPVSIFAWLTAGVVVSAAPIRVVILSGANVHDWQATTPFLQKMYEDSERFQVVRIVDDVSKVSAETFADAEVIVSNWTCHPVMTGGPWTAEGKSAFAEAIRKGKGMVSFHAACAACNDWPEFQEISGLTWKLDHTSHTTYHTFKVVITDKKHAITRGMSDFWITDELYQRMVKLTPAPFETQAQAFADKAVQGTGAWEPMLITTRLGKGRGVNLLLGHDVQALRNIAWQTLMLRATQWAANKPVTIPIPENWPTTPAAAAIVGVDVDATIAAATQYSYGQKREPLFLVEQWVNDATSRTGKSAEGERAARAAKLAGAIAKCKSAEAKAFFCHQLGMIGTHAEVPILAPLLKDKGTAMMARFALERITDPAAAAALRDALTELTGDLRIGVIDSIGQRADADSVAAIVPFLRDANATTTEATAEGTATATATAAASALGRIATVEAAEAIKQALLESDGPLRAVYIDAYLLCAERLLTAGDKAQAAGIYKLLYAPAQRPMIRAAALRGLVRSQPTQANMLFREAFDAGVPELIGAIVDLVRELPRAGDTRLIAAAAMRLPADLQVRMIAALADRGDKSAASSIRFGLDAESEAVRLAVIAAIARLGDESDTGWLTDRAMNGSDAERVAAMDALQTIPMAENLRVIRKAGLVFRKADLPRNLALEGIADSPDGLGSDGQAGGDQAAIDGNPATYWDEADGQPLYRYRVTWKEPRRVSAVVVVGYAFESYVPKDFEILCDDKVVKTVRNAVYDRAGVEALFGFEPVICTSVELRITGYYGNSPAIRELEIYDWPVEGVTIQP